MSRNFSDRSTNNFFVTIYTDTSWCPENKIAVWAFYAKCSKGVLKEHGQCKGTIACSSTGEMYAIYEAIKTCKAEWPELNGFFVNTDSLTSCHLLWPESIKQSDHFKGDHLQRLKRYIREICPEKESPSNPWLRVKHVKAHTGQDDIRSYLNRWCDKNALAGLKDMRAEVKSGDRSTVSP